jgi:tetratricopeptide (TPR) repeat protein
MAIHSITRPLTRPLIAALLFATAAFAQSPPLQNPTAAPCPTPNQTRAQPPAQDQTAKSCTQPPPAKKPSTAEQFPFPGEPAKPAKPANPPDSPDPASTPSDAASQHPFPTQPPPKLPGDDSSSSSSSSNDTPDLPTDDNPATKGDPSNPPEGTSVHRKLPKVKRVQTDDERVDEDLNVARFYMRDENYQGAYLRAKDAVNLQPDYSATHFALAEIAEKMKKKDEAVAEYQTYLKLDPDGEKAKAAKQALAGLQ